MSVRTRAASKKPQGPSNIAGPKRSKPSHAQLVAAAAGSTQSPQAHTPEPSSEPVFFWKPEDADTGYLSQWYQDPFSDPSDPSVVFSTAEHYMMYHKAMLFDPSAAPAILAAASPGEVRALGRQVANYDDAVWAKNRLRVVTDGNRLKFTRGAQAEKLRSLLLATGDRELVEASPVDRIWGIGFSPAKAVGSDRKKWGMNLLGKAITAVREELNPRENEESVSNSNSSADPADTP